MNHSLLLKRAPRLAIESRKPIKVWDAISNVFFLSPLSLSSLSLKRKQSCRDKAPRHHLSFFFPFPGWLDDYYSQFSRKNEKENEKVRVCRRATHLLPGNEEKQTGQRKWGSSFVFALIRALWMDMVVGTLSAHPYIHMLKFIHFISKKKRKKKETVLGEETPHRVVPRHPTVFFSFFFFSLCRFFLMICLFSF